MIARPVHDARRRLLRRLALATVVLAAVACTRDVPFAISHEMAITSRLQPDAVTVVFFTDFQCPYCRRTHQNLAPLLAQRQGHVRLVIRHVPLARHPDARTAARAAVCFDAIVASHATPPDRERTSVLSEEYTRTLMAATDLSEAACEHLAEEHGIAPEAFRRCLSEPSTDARIEQDLALFDSVHGDGVPLLYVGRNRLEGAQSRSALEAAFEAIEKY